MTTPASGQIAISDIIANDGTNIGYGNSLYWLDVNTKDGVSDMNSAHNRVAFLNNNLGNCSNGNCTVINCNCGNINCPNCLNCNAINCVNCDTREWFQGNCNCACTYNCTQNTRSYNCNCNCACDCFWSDDALKNKEGNITNALDIIKQLNGFYYTGNDIAKSLGLKTDRTVGLSAQDLLKVIPELVNKDALGGKYMSVNYPQVTALLVEAIKALDEKIGK